VFRDDKGLTPHVPPSALHKPAGATVDGQGHVRCVICQATVPLASADVVGQGYRCSACSHKAELALLTGGGDAAAHFNAAERTELAHSGMLTMIGGATFMAVGLLLLTVPLLRYGVICLIGGGATIGVGWHRRSAAR
jgi:hypothetical protein